MGLSTPILALFALVSIQVAIALIYKFSGSKGSYAFSPASALAMAELTKLAMSTAFHMRSTTSTPLHASEGPLLPSRTTSVLVANGTLTRRLEMAWHAARRQVDRNFALHTAGLAFLYLLNNHLGFYLFLKADPGTISLFKSGSGFISCIVLWMISRTVTANQWVCVSLQAVGLALAQYDSCGEHSRYGAGTYLFLFTTVTMTAVSGVWNEHLVKTHRVSLNVQNMCLYTFGFLFNLFAFYLRKIAGLESKGFFEGYGSPLSASVVISNSVIGLAITAVYKYADVLVKQIGNMVSTSILIILGVLLMGETASFQSTMGCLVVFMATFLYFQGNAQKANPNPDISKCPEVNSPSEESSKITPKPSSRCTPIFRIGAVVAVMTFLLIVAGFVGQSDGTHLSSSLVLNNTASM